MYDIKYKGPIHLQSIQEVVKHQLTNVPYYYPEWTLFCAITFRRKLKSSYI